MADDKISPETIEETAKNTNSLKTNSTLSPQHEKLQTEDAHAQTTKPDYIEPPKRRLGPHTTEVNEPFSSLKLIDPVNFQLRKLVGLLIASGKHKPGFSSDFLDEVTELTAQFMDNFVDFLHRLTEIQRHHKPGMADLELCLSAQNVSLSELYSEYLHTRGLDRDIKTHAGRISTELSGLLREYYAINYTLQKDDPLLVFHANQQHEIAALAPRQSLKRDFIPSFLPDLPPDFTFTLTGNYMQKITDLKEIKLRLVEESRMNEASLYNLIDDNERRWQQLLERDLEQLEASDDESAVSEVMSTLGGKLATDVESPEAGSAETNANQEVGQTDKKENAKLFDFVEYARKRRAERDKYAQNTERRRKLRRENVFHRAERAFSPYAKQPPTTPESLFFKSVLESAFTEVIKATRYAEKRKKERLAMLMEEKRKRDEEQEEKNGSFEFGFAFNPDTNILDDSDEEEHLETLKEFDFGDTSQYRNGEEAVVEGNNENTIMGNADVLHAAGMHQSPHAGQVSGKVPLKTPVAVLETALRKPDDSSEGKSYIEDELEQHFGLDSVGENENGTNEYTNQQFLDRNVDINGSSRAERESVGCTELRDSTENGVHLVQEQNQSEALVLWGSFESEMSEKDDLQDI